MEAPLSGGPHESLGPQWYFQSFTHGVPVALVDAAWFSYIRCIIHAVVSIRILMHNF